MEFATNNYFGSEYLETKILSAKDNLIQTTIDNSKLFFKQQASVNNEIDSEQQSISFLALQTSGIALKDDQSYYSLEPIPFITTLSSQTDNCFIDKPKSRARTPKLCRVCSKSVLDLRRHLEQCHKELSHLQIVKIVAESKRFRKDLKKQPSKSVRNVLLCPFMKETGEICNRPIVEYKLYQHLKFYHHIHPKSDEGIRLVRQARANPFASKSMFPDCGDNILESRKESPSKFDLDSEPYEVRLSFPVEETATALPTFTDTLSTHITSSPIQSDSQSSSPLPQTAPSSPIQSQPCVSTTPSSISCQVLSIGLNIAVSCANLASIAAPQETTCVVTKHENDTVFISIPSLTLSDA
ncbi:hypothetical protein LOD99_6964 [Oopsacas minuta]|uniref:C2H2-type domain-containing protein n=1 Tax=Oopsacas minuta TaxID=111878 RepID=A0AAV7JJD3_9METZ|nr:hypothetical protein LOD99_6964 [Oopsacas minuta]